MKHDFVAACLITALAHHTTVMAEQAQLPLPEMVKIPAGEFEMGCVSGIDCKSRELPVHTVTLPAFLMSKTEVSENLWTKCVEAGACFNYQKPERKEANLPASYVSWDDTQNFIVWLNEVTGDNYRLPSESEWEYAARAGTSTPFSTGECISWKQANSEGNAFKAAGCMEEGEYRKQTVPVASFPANGFGLHDMHGNLWEWVADCWHWSYEGAPVDGSTWYGTDSACDRRVMRGGAWQGTTSYMRSAYRFRFPKEARSGGLGFRLVKSIN